jgi:acyl CoA:acetate/3-ketoacid CoA transferase beta subunit
VLEPDPETCELELTLVHPGVSVDQVKEQTGWPLRTAERVVAGAAPTEAELAALRSLKTVEERGG